MTPDRMWLVRFAGGRIPERTKFTNPRQFIEQLPDGAVHGGVYTVKTAGGPGNSEPVEFHAVPEFGVAGQSVVCTLFEGERRGGGRQRAPQRESSGLMISNTRAASRPTLSASPATRAPSSRAAAAATARVARCHPSGQPRQADAVTSPV